MHLTNPPTTRSSAYAQVALPLPLARAFTYRIPDSLREKVFVGCRVEVSFGRRQLSGIVVELSNTTHLAAVKPIREIRETYLPSELLKLTRWISEYYGCSLGEAAQSVLPPVFRRASRREGLRGVIAVRGSADEIVRRLKRARRQCELAQRIVDVGGHVGVRTVMEEWGFAPALIRNLVATGVAEIRPEIDTSPLEQIENEVLRLTADQARALERIREALAAGGFSPFLLYGVTGSGKTEVYLRSAQTVLSSGGGCIVLVPEIGLLPQAIVRYRKIFGETLAILHSRLTGAERFEIWRKIESGECRLVLGPRSAIFSPVRNLRLIVVDEEQDDSYKQEDKPRYHARSVALMRGKFESLAVIMGSATPSAESFHHAQAGRYEYLKLPSRVEGTALPSIHFVDMREASLEGPFFSSYLLERLEKNIDRGDQSIIFLNKRGHARFIQCKACGWVAACENCDISLIYHRVSHRMKCHFCGYGRRAVERCDKCRSNRLYFGGAGTQRVELDLAGLFPGVGILRMDADTTSGKEGHRRILEQFSGGDYPILIGTQMVSKGHHFPRVRLVGVLFAEEGLNFPDFRSAERTFQQLTQVAGRAGRAGHSGEVVVQTYTPEHPVFAYLQPHDYDRFMLDELEVRRRVRYPPFTRIILASCLAAKPDLLARAANEWAEWMRRRLAGRPVDVLGPAPPAVPRIKGRYRQQILIKGHLSSVNKSELVGGFQDFGKGVELRWDVDPEGFF